MKKGQTLSKNAFKTPKNCNKRNPKRWIAEKVDRHVNERWQRRYRRRSIWKICHEWAVFAELSESLNARQKR